MGKLSRIKSYLLAHRLLTIIVSVIILIYIILYLWSAHYGRYHRYDQIPDLIGIELPKYEVLDSFSEWDTEVGDKFADVSDATLKLKLVADSTCVNKQVVDKGWDWNSENNSYIYERGIYDFKQIGRMIATWYPEDCIIHYSCVVEMALPDYIMIYGIMILILILLCSSAYFILRVSYNAIKSRICHLQ